jgi:hypothetical protein
MSCSLTMATSTPPISSSTARSFVHRLSVERYGDFYKAYRIYAYPTPRKSGVEVYMRTDSPGLVSYVLGDDWESRVTRTGAFPTIELL